MELLVIILPISLYKYKKKITIFIKRNIYVTATTLQVKYIIKSIRSNKKPTFKSLIITTRKK